MATARDIIQGAYARLGLIALGQDLDPDRARGGLTALNDLMLAWAGEGVSLGLTSELALSDDFPLDPRFVEGVKALLAVRLADDAGFDAPAPVQRAASKGWRAICATCISAPNARQDDTLIWLPSLRRYGFK